MRRTRSTTTALAAAAALLALGACSNDTTRPSPTPDAGPCTSGASPVPVSLPVGGVLTLTDPAALDCIALSAPDGAAGRFLLVAANADTLADSATGYALVDSVARGTIARVAAQRVRGAASPPRRGSEMLEARLRARTRQLQQRAHPLRGVAASRRAGAPGTARAAPLPAVGDLLHFKVPAPNATDACAQFDSVTAVVKFVGTHGIILQDTTAPPDGFTASDFAAIADEFDTKIYPADTIHFGGPADVDGNGHVFLLYTPVVNAGTPRGSAGGVIEGFFFAGDLFSTTDCAESNMAELFYLIVPDPAGKFSDARSVDDVRQATRGTIAHEFQHMINFSVRAIDEGLQTSEATWLDEGLSHFAEELVGRYERGFTDLQSLGAADVAGRPSDLDDFNAFFLQNLARFREWLSHPSQLGATSSAADTSLAVRGAAWSLLRYAADHYAGGDVPAFTRALVAGPDTSVRNLSLRAGVPFDSIVAGWLVADAVDDAGIARLDPRYTFVSWNVREVESALNSGVYPLTPTALDGGPTITRTIDAAAGDYFQLSLAAGARALVGALDGSGAPLTFPSARLYVVRVQ
ncbi:MAG: hypothetical protein IRY91_08225 [Gemmatimonadaceae bacterium]|nr:hypothetical protein [Gemmatimonadaceae bacterium]